MSVASRFARNSGTLLQRATLRPVWCGSAYPPHRWASSDTAGTTPTTQRRSAYTNPSRPGQKYAQKRHGPPSEAQPAKGAFVHSPVIHTTTHPDIPDLTIDVISRGLLVHCPSRGILQKKMCDWVWLRDICQEVGTTIQPGTGQKLVGTTDIPLVQGTLLDEAHPPIIEKSPEGHFSLVLTFSKEYPVLNKFSQVFSPSPPSPPDEPHVSRLPLDLVLSSCSKEASRAAHHDVAGAPMPWDGSNLTPFPPSSGAPSTHADVKPSALPTDEAASSRARPVRVDYSTLLEDAPNAHQARYSVVKGLVEDGLVFVTGMPTDVKGSQPDPRQADSPELARLATMFGEIRNTFYGMLWDVRSLPSSLSRNIAYTNVDLGLHMDLLYFQNPPRFQFLHMLRNQVKGGQSIFVDSYKVAEHLWTTDPDAWRILSSVPVTYHYKNDGRYYMHRHPVLERPARSGGSMGPTFSSSASSSDDSSWPMPRLAAVNYSPPFQGPLGLFHTDTFRVSQRDDFYRAFQKFADLTLEPRFRYERQLNEGECVIFDNRRVLHSRKGFEFLDDGTGVAEDEDKVQRWLKGCYVDGDAIWSSYRVLRQKMLDEGLISPDERQWTSRAEEKY